MHACPHATVEIFCTNNKGGGKEVEGRDGERERGIKGKREKSETRRAVLLPIGDVESRSPPGTVERGPKASSRRAATVIFPYESVRTRPRSSATHHVPCKHLCTYNIS